MKYVYILLCETNISTVILGIYNTKNHANIEKVKCQKEAIHFLEYRVIKEKII